MRMKFNYVTVIFTSSIRTSSFMMMDSILFRTIPRSTIHLYCFTKANVNTTS